MLTYRDAARGGRVRFFRSKNGGGRKGRPVPLEEQGLILRKTQGSAARIRATEKVPIGDPRQKGQLLSKSAGKNHRFHQCLHEADQSPVEGKSKALGVG